VPTKTEYMRKKFDSAGNPLYRGITPAIPKFVYFILAEGVNKIKIGIAEDVRKRLAGLQTSSPVVLSIYGFIQFSNAYRARKAEQAYHKLFESKRSHNEWFNFDKEMAEKLQEFRSDDEIDVDALRQIGFDISLLSENEIFKFNH